jgi:hypothetical protein
MWIKRSKATSCNGNVFMFTNDGKYYFARLSRIFASKLVEMEVISRAEHLNLEDFLLVKHLQIDKTHEPSRLIFRNDALREAPNKFDNMEEGVLSPKTYFSWWGSLC